MNYSLSQILNIQESGEEENSAKKKDNDTTEQSPNKTAGEEKETEEEETGKKGTGEKESEEKMEVSETAAEPDTIELTSNEFENDLLGAAVPAVKENASEGLCF